MFSLWTDVGQRNIESTFGCFGRWGSHPMDGDIPPSPQRYSAALYCCAAQAEMGVRCQTFTLWESSITTHHNTQHVLCAVVVLSMSNHLQVPTWPPQFSSRYLWCDGKIMAIWIKVSSHEFSHLHSGLTCSEVFSDFNTTIFYCE